MIPFLTFLVVLLTFGACWAGVGLYRAFTAGLLLVLFAGPAQAQNPCAVPQPTLSLVTATSNVVADFSDYTAALGSAQAWTDVAVGIFAKGASAASAVPVASVSVPKAGWTLVPATTTCYQHRPAILFGVAPNTEYDLYVRVTRATPDVAASGWAGPLPFGRLGSPAAPTNLRTTP